jgi:hypothetical protein
VLRVVHPAQFNKKYSEHSNKITKRITNKDDKKAQKDELNKIKIKLHIDSIPKGQKLSGSNNDLEKKSLENEIKKIKQEIYFVNQEIYFVNQKETCEFTLKKYLRNNLFNLSKIELTAIQMKLKSDSSKKTNDQDKVHLFYIPGNCDYVCSCFNTIENLLEKFKKQGLYCTAHLIDPRGVGFNYGKGKFYNKGLFEDQIVNDYVSIIKHEINNSVKKENSHKFIVLGRSLGGGIATKVVRKLHEQDYKVILHNDRSFNKTVSFIAPYARQPSKPGKFKKWLIKAFTWCANGFMKLLNWSLDSIAHWKKIPENFKSYDVIKCRNEGTYDKKRKKQGSKRQADGVIPYYGSLHYSLKPERQELKKGVYDLITIIESLKELNDSKQYKFGDIFKKSIRKKLVKKEILNKLKSKKSWFIRKCFRDKFKRKLLHLDGIYNIHLDGNNKSNNSNSKFTGIMNMKLTEQNKKEIQTRLKEILFWEVHGFQLGTKSIQDDEDQQDDMLHNRPKESLYSPSLNDAGKPQMNLMQFFVQKTSMMVRYHNRRKKQPRKAKKQEHWSIQFYKAKKPSGCLSDLYTFFRRGKKKKNGKRKNVNNVKKDNNPKIKIEI